ncbi:MAG: ABC transporter permease [Ruminococcus sp.]|uniref:ABC transporter permease n=1 Tax=Ruminococcus sp. TaxID=41978 RepID=UPI0025E41208|nr:ABC transporter permease [Ruminococcus sp.]MCR5600331.1 ABC transporter permease [Ruminococcus sp.]
MRDIITVTKKEIKAFFGDKAILLQMFLLPFIIVFGYGMLMTSMMNSQKESAEQLDKPVVAYSINAPEEFSDALSALKITPASDNDIEKYKKQVKDKETDLLIVFPDDFKMSEPGADQLSNVDIYYNSEKSNSMELFSKTSAVFTTMQPRTFSYNEDADTDYDLFDSASMVRKMLGGIIPLMVFMAVYLVCMNLAANSIAGDKEKGFLNTLLVTPIKRGNLAAGKSLSILIVAIIASCSAFIGMAVSMPQLAKSMELTEGTQYSIAEYMILFGAVVTGAFVLVALLLIFSTLAKDVKQATTLSPILLFVIMIPSLMSSTEGFSESIEKLGTTNYLIPVWNSVKMIQDVIKIDYTTSNVCTMIAVNIAAAVLGVFIVGTLFKREKIVNG